ncbi:hypothetical protein K449DRAFT_433218 [Hypoxylon sp. EC38]|nr:hypothetical protein K449DRAFT_433218 [Hypoxylon sp. EC38]
MLAIRSQSVKYRPQQKLRNSNWQPDMLVSADGYHKVLQTLSQISYIHKDLPSFQRLTTNISTSYGDHLKLNPDNNTLILQNKEVIKKIYPNIQEFEISCIALEDEEHTSKLPFARITIVHKFSAAETRGKNPPPSTWYFGTEKQLQQDHDETLTYEALLALKGVIATLALGDKLEWASWEALHGQKRTYKKTSSLDDPDNIIWKKLKPRTSKQFWNDIVNVVLGRCYNSSNHISNFAESHGRFNMAFKGQHKISPTLAVRRASGGFYYGIDGTEGHRPVHTRFRRGQDELVIFRGQHGRSRGTRDDVTKRDYRGVKSTAQ